MNADKISTNLIVTRIASRVIQSYEFATENALKQYLKDHPGADRANHSVASPKAIKPTQQEDVGTKSKPTIQEKSDNVGGVTEGAGEKLEGVAKWKPKKVYENKIRMSRKEFHDLLDKGHYSVISAGKNDKDADEKNWAVDDPRIVKRHHELMDKLDSMGVYFTEALGKYGSEEYSLVVFHDKEDVYDGTGDNRAEFIAHYPKEKAAKVQDELDKIGESMNQNSVLHGNMGKNSVHFTTGEHKGKDCGNTGFEKMDNADDYYTSIDDTGGGVTKVQMNIDDCFKRKLM